MLQIVKSKSLKPDMQPWNMRSFIKKLLKTNMLSKQQVINYSVDQFCFNQMITSP